MGILSNIVAGAKKKLVLLKANLLYKKEQLFQKKFFKIPTKLELLKIAATTLLVLLLKQLFKTPKTKSEMKAFLQTNQIAKTIIKQTLEDLEDDQMSQIVLACYGELPEENIPEIDEEYNAEQILNFVDKINDIDTRINTRKNISLFNRIKNAIDKVRILEEKTGDVLNRITTEYSGIAITALVAKEAISSGTIKSQIEATIEAEKNAIKTKIDQLKAEKEKIEARIDSYKYLIQHTLESTRDLFTKTDHPPKYRVKYVQKLTRQIYGLLKIEYAEASGRVKQEIASLLNVLKKTDNVIIAVTMITSLYIINRKILQKKSLETLKTLAQDTVCIDFTKKENTLEPFDPSINVIPFQLNFNCPRIKDDVIVPHIPITEKIKNLSCEVAQNEEKEVEAEEAIDLVTHAIIRNISEKPLVCIATKDSYLTTDKQIATLIDKPIYSPVDGTIDVIENNEIVLKDISDAEQDYLSTQIDLLSQKYERLNSVKSFLKNYFVQSLYPPMLAVAIIDDTSTRNQYTKVQKAWEEMKDMHKMIDKEYNKQIKKITGKDNVETHAKDETLYVIKNELEKQEEIFYKHLELINETAINLAKKTQAKSNEYQLMEYYLLDLGAMFNQLEATDKIETEFKDKINEFIRRRVIIDGYNKNKIADKINDLIKDIEKGTSAGNWFLKAMEIYLPTKKLDDVKKWLSGLAQKNKKLEGVEKDQAVNQVMFLFQLYLDYDEIVKKYNILKKETTPKLATIEEGNWILNFTQQLWKDYKSLPKEIEEIQKTIDSLSMFQTYSIIEWNGYQARLYTIADEPICKSTETDPYLNPKTAFGFGDIQYWLKYCALATLASCANPATGWSTGWIFPTPVLFPVVYIPIKAIYTKYGFMVIGLSICGIYLFPWVLFVNLTTKYTTPFGDPTTLIKKQIEALKKEISEQLLNLKRNTIKPLLDESKKNIEKSEEELKQLKNKQKEYIKEKPERLLIDPNNIEAGIQENPNYTTEYFNWIEKNKIIAEKIAESQVSLWKEEKKAMILQEAYTYGKSLKGISGIKDVTGQVQVLIGKQIEKLMATLDDVDNIISVLPIALAPESANFAMTIKNPKPIIKIKDNLEDMIDATALNGVVEKFRLKSEDLTSSKYLNKLIFSVVNDKIYRRALSAARIKIIIQDAFPKYENLTLTNYPWLMFLYKDFVTTGAKTYGFPGNLPLPV